MKTQILLWNAKNLEENLDFDQRSLALFLHGHLYMVYILCFCPIFSLSFLSFCPFYSLFFSSLFAISNLTCFPCLSVSFLVLYPISIFSVSLFLFICLPRRDERIWLCVWICYVSGLSPDLQSMEQIRRIMRPTDVPDTGDIITALLTWLYVVFILYQGLYLLLTELPWILNKGFHSFPIGYC